MNCWEYNSLVTEVKETKADEITQTIATNEEWSDISLGSLIEMELFPQPVLGTS